MHFKCNLQICGIGIPKGFTLSLCLHDEKFSCVTEITHMRMCCIYFLRFKISASSLSIFSLYFVCLFIHVVVYLFSHVYWVSSHSRSRRRWQPHLVCVYACMHFIIPLPHLTAITVVLVAWAPVWCQMLFLQILPLNEWRIIKESINEGCYSHNKTLPVFVHWKSHYDLPLKRNNKKVNCQKVYSTVENWCLC